MDVFQGLGQGFAVALQPGNFVACLVGVLVGTLVGILPGLGPAATLAMLMPLAFGLGPTGSMIMFAGIFYGARYGGAVTSILANLPGESSSVMTCVDGYQLARQGRAGPALGMAAIASFFAGTVGVVGLMFLAPTLAAVALDFGPPEYFALMLMGLTLVMFLGGKSMLKALMMGCFGLLLSLSGIDVMSGTLRLNFGQEFLLGGFSFLVVAMGVFAVGEILLNMEEGLDSSFFKVPNRLSDLLPTLDDIRVSFWTLVRSTLIGFAVGLIPGGNPTVATFLAYGATKAISKDPDSFGKGNIQGVAAPESADNASASGGLVPLLTLGLPTTASSAIMLGALMMTGLQPGPLLLKQQPEFFWGVVASMYIGNVLLLILNLPLIPIFANALRIPYHIFYPAILAICSIGVYSFENNIADVFLMGIFGIIGYGMKKAGYPAGPLVLALILGPLLEKSLRQSMTMFYGNPTGFFERPIAAVLLAGAFLAVAAATMRWINTVREGKNTAQVESVGEEI